MLLFRKQSDFHVFISSLPKMLSLICLCLSLLIPPRFGRKQTETNSDFHIATKEPADSRNIFAQ